jgi:hypothetical protein
MESPQPYEPETASTEILEPSPSPELARRSYRLTTRPRCWRSFRRTGPIASFLGRIERWRVPCRSRRRQGGRR